MSDEKVQALKILSRFGIGLGILGGLLSVFGLYFLFIANESLSWSSVEGSVVKAEVRADVSLRNSRPLEKVVMSPQDKEHEL